MHGFLSYQSYLVLSQINTLCVTYLDSIPCSTREITGHLMHVFIPQQSGNQVGLILPEHFMD